MQECSLPKQNDLEFALPQPSPEGIVEFQAFYKKKYGEALTVGEAREALTHLMTIVYWSANIVQRVSMDDNI